MKTFLVTIQGSGFADSLPPDGELIRGFITNRYIQAPDAASASTLAEAEVKQHPTVQSMILETEIAHDENGLWRIEALEATPLKFFQRLLPKKGRGFIFYQDE